MTFLHLLLIVTGIVPREVQNEVHEWGVVVFEQNVSLMCGESWQDIDYYPDYYTDEMCAEAPVVWIHGQPFDKATFTVNTGEEAITLYYPEPNSVSSNRIEWEISTFSETIEATEEVLPEEVERYYDGPFYWAMDSWREVNSLVFNFQTQARKENFLYYECTVNRDFTDNFFTWSDDGYPVFENTDIPNALYFSPGGVFEISQLDGKVLPFNFPFATSSLSETDIINTFSYWGRSNFDMSEIEALWATWEPVFRSSESSSSWLVFPIAPEHHNTISTISLNIEPNRLITYERLYLGAIELSK